MELTLYGAIISPFVRKVRLFMLEKGFDYQFEQVLPRQVPEWYWKISPLGRIPGLKDGEQSFADSSVICHYLEDKYPSKSNLCGETPLERARISWFEKYADYEIAPLATFTVFFNRVLARPMGLEVNQAAIDSALNKLPKHWDYLEQQLEGKQYLVANRLTLADLALVTHWVNFAYGGEQLDAERWPNLAAHKERVLGRESAKALLVEEGAFMQEMAASK